MDRRITVLSDVKDLGELLEGAALEQATLTPASEASPEAAGRGTTGRMQLVLEGTRAMLEQPPADAGGLFKRPKIPWTKYRLALSHITSASVERDEQAAEHAPLLACDAVPGGYQLTVRSPDGLRVVVGLDQLDGTFADMGSVIRVP